MQCLSHINFIKSLEVLNIFWDSFPPQCNPSCYRTEDKYADGGDDTQQQSLGCGLNPIVNLQIRSNTGVGVLSDFFKSTLDQTQHRWFLILFLL